MRQSEVDNVALVGIDGMATSSNEYRPSLFLSLAKTALFSLERVMPKPIFARFYHMAFTLYRTLIRWLYLRFWVWSAVTRNRKERQRTETVFRVMPYSLVGWRGLEATSVVLDKVGVLGAKGAYVECGVARGGSAALMALAAAKSRQNPMLWLFDSFEGLPEPTLDDYAGSNGKTGPHVRPLQKGSCLGTYKEVEQLLFVKLRLSRDNIRMVKGWFQDTLPVSRDKIDSIAVLRLDGDWYESTRCCLDNLYDLVSENGYIIVDDYGSCYGAQKAVDEFMNTRGLKPTMVFDGRGGCYFAKPTLSSG